MRKCEIRGPNGERCLKRHSRNGKLHTDFRGHEWKTPSTSPRSKSSAEQKGTVGKADDTDSPGETLATPKLLEDGPVRQGKTGDHPTAPAIPAEDPTPATGCEETCSECHHSVGHSDCYCGLSPCTCGVTFSEYKAEDALLATERAKLDGANELVNGLRFQAEQQELALAAAREREERLRAFAERFVSYIDHDTMKDGNGHKWVRLCEEARAALAEMR